MFHGYSTIGAVALAILQDNIGKKRVDGTRHTLDQAIETVCWRKQTLAAAGSGTSYVWWWITLDEGEPSIDFDSGKMGIVFYPGGSHRYVPLIDGNFESQTLLGDFWPQNPNYHNIIGPVETAMLQMGLQPYQRCLSAYTESWATDYYGESDCHTDCELLYVEPNPAPVVYMPVVLGAEFGPRAPMKELYVG